MKFSECTENLRKGSEAIKRMLPTVKEAVWACMEFNKRGLKIKDVMDIGKNRNAKNAEEGNKEYYLDLHTIMSLSSWKLGKLVKKKVRQGYKVMMPNFNLFGEQIKAGTIMVNQIDPSSVTAERSK